MIVAIPEPFCATVRSEAVKVNAGYTEFTIPQLNDYELVVVH